MSDVPLAVCRVVGGVAPSWELARCLAGMLFESGTLFESGRLIDLLLQSRNTVAGVHVWRVIMGAIGLLFRNEFHPGILSRNLGLAQQQETRVHPSSSVAGSAIG